ASHAGTVLRLFRNEPATALSEPARRLPCGSCSAMLRPGAAMTTNSMDDSGATSAEPQSFRGLVLSPSLTVKDLEKSLAWYQDVVGFTVDRKHERDGKLRAVSLRAGAVRLLIGQDDGAKGWDRVKGE